MHVVAVSAICYSVSYNLQLMSFLGIKKKEVKKISGLGLSVTRDENFGEWYSQVIYACFFS